MTDQINEIDAKLAQEIEERLNSEITFGDLIAAEKVMKKTRKLRLACTGISGAIGGYTTYAALAAGWFVPGSTVVYGTIWATLLYSGYGYACTTGATEIVHHGFVSRRKRKNQRVWKSMKKQAEKVRSFVSRKPEPEPSSS